MSVWSNTDVVLFVIAVLSLVGALILGLVFG